MRKRSKLQQLLLTKLTYRKLLEGVVEEYPFLRWRFDFAWPKEGVAVECDGGVYGVKVARGRFKGQVFAGRHTQGRGYEEGCRKLNAAAADGWIVLRFTAGMLEGWGAVDLIETALRDRREQRCET